MPALPFQTTVFDSTLGTQVFMLPIDAAFAVANYPARYSLVTSGAAPVVQAPYLTTFNANQPVTAFRNVIEGGDFTTNLWQRGTAFTAIAATPTYTADRWAARGAGGSSISVSRIALANGALPTFLNAMQFGRANANADVNPIYLAQEIESQNVYRLQGLPVVLSFYALSGALFSAALANFNVQLTMGTGVDEGVTKALLFAAAGFAGYANVPVISGAATNQLTTAWQRFYVAFNMPVTATEAAVIFNYTPVGAAGATDFVQIAGVQLEAGTFPSQFEHRSQIVETELCQRFCYVINEPAANVIVGVGMNTTAAIQNFGIPLPQPMRVAPTVTVAVGTFKTNQVAVQTATTISALTPHTTTMIGIAGNSAGVAGQAVTLTGGGGAGVITASADL